MTKKSDSEKAKDDWMNTKWRPAMGWMYMGVCIFDFVLAPVLWAVIQFWETQAANDAFRQWQPMTLQGAGLFHMAMGAVLGLAAWGRTQEKLNGTASNNLPEIDAPAAPAPVRRLEPTLSSGPVTTGFAGKKAPPPAHEPEI
jgi:Holin of 3TMs, for gene-transfer release